MPNGAAAATWATWCVAARARRRAAALAVAGLRRLLAASAPPPGPHQPQAGATARGRLLEAVEEELGERAAALGPLPPAARASQQDAALMRRLYKFNLPPAEMAHGRELLSKVAAIDAARATAEGVRACPVPIRLAGVGAGWHALSRATTLQSRTGDCPQQPTVASPTCHPVHCPQDARALAAQLKAAELAHRQAEFARARAEAIATAR